MEKRLGWEVRVRIKRNFETSCYPYSICLRQTKGIFLSSSFGIFSRNLIKLEYFCMFFGLAAISLDQN